VLTLELGQWARWRANFRLVEEHVSDWSYQKWVVNVAYLHGPPPVDLFQTTEPVTVADDMAQLF
jgi:hypothetical protein